jgi:hypothetical protein
MTDFVLESAPASAAETLADRQSFQLDPERWEVFVTALDTPPQVHPRLARLLQEPSVLGQAPATTDDVATTCLASKGQPGEHCPEKCRTVVRRGNAHAVPSAPLALPIWSKTGTTLITGHRSMADTRFEVRMSEALAQELEAIADEAQLSKAEVFRRAIALYGLTKRAIMNKEEVIIRNGDRERQLVSI